MSRLLNFILFLSLFLAVLGGMHFYVYRRLVVLPQIPQPWTLILRWALAGLWVLIPVAFLSVRFANNSAGRMAFLPVNIWLGLLFILFAFSLLFDLLRAGGWLAAKFSGGEVDQARRLFLMRSGALAVGASGLAAGGWGLFRGLSLAVVPVPVRIRGLGKSFEGYTIAQLSDVHLGPVRGRAWMEEVVAQTNAINPDLVVITGDLIDGSVEQLRTDVEPLSRLKARDGVYFVTGNHEVYFGVEPWMAHLPTLGIRVLRNQGVEIRRGRDRLHLAGVDDHEGRRLGLGEGADVGAAVAGRPRGAPSVLLAHQPRVAEEARKHGVDLVLSGHTHGGQIWPFHYLVYLQQPYLRGLNDHRGTQVYVSQGTGFWGPPLRLGTQAEITQVTLSSGA